MGFSSVILSIQRGSSWRDRALCFVNWPRVSSGVWFIVGGHRWRKDVDARDPPARVAMLVPDVADGVKWVDRHVLPIEDWPELRSDPCEVAVASKERTDIPDTAQQGFPRREPARAANLHLEPRRVGTLPVGSS